MRNAAVWSWRSIVVVLMIAALLGEPRAEESSLPLVISGSADGTIRDWSAAGKEKYNISAHEGAIRALVLSTGGKDIISCGSDKTVKVWSADDGTQENGFDAHDKAVLSLALNRDGRILATGGADSKIKLWNPLTGKLLHTISGHSQPVYALAWSVDGRLLASGSADKLIQIWRPDGQPAGTIIGHDETVTALTWTKDGRLISGSADGYIKIWTAPDLALAGHQKAHDRPINAIALDPSGSILATAASDGRIKLWTMSGATFTESATASAGKAINCIVWSRDGRFVITGGADHTLRYWSSRDLSPIQKVNCPDGAITALVAAGD